MNRTKIVCTIGPASEKLTILRSMIKAGMNVARLNFSHGSYRNHTLLIKRIRQLSKEMNRPIAILQDLQGPRIRIGKLSTEQIKLKNQEKIILSTKINPKLDRVPVNYSKLTNDLKKNDRILLADGLIELKTLSIKGKEIICRVINGGVLTSHAGINLPDTQLSISIITKKDKQDLRFGIQQGVDFVALSFVTTDREIKSLKRMISRVQQELNLPVGKNKKSPIKVISKIERPEAVSNFSAILSASDGIMVARGDLGIEMPPQDVPLIQKNIIDRCLESAKPVIVATQMLNSMIEQPRPTRAEVSDVANAVIDHTDAIMLSGETASGKYPVQSVKMMSKIIEETEASIYDDFILKDLNKQKSSDLIAINQMACYLAKKVNAKFILVASSSGDTGRLISRYRPELPILVATNQQRVRRQLCLSWGVAPFVLPICKNIDELIKKATIFIKEHFIIKAGDKIIVVAGQPVGISQNVNLVKVHVL